MAYEIKERSIGEIIDGAFQLYRNHFGVFVGVALCVVVPSALAVALVSWLVTGNPDPNAIQVGAQAASGAGTPPPNLALLMQKGLVMLLTFPIQIFAGVLEDAVLTLTVADAYLGRPVSLGSGFRRCLPALWVLLGASVLKGLGIVLGIFCLVVPGVLLTLRWLLSTQAIVVEDKGARASLARSRELTAQNYGRLLLLLLLMIIIGLALSFGLRSLLPDAVQRVPVVGQLLQQAYQIVVAPVSSAVLTLAYFDLRVRKEGFDLERLAVGLGASSGEAGVAPHGT